MDRNTHKISASVLSLAVLIAISWPETLWAQRLTIQGKVSNSQGQPVIGAATKFRVQILSPDPAVHCILYDETHTLDLSLNAGLFSINLGEVNPARVSRDPPLAYTIEQVISNRAPLSVSGTYCAPIIAGPATYIPTINDNRKVIIQFLDPSTMGTNWETIPEMDLNPVAYAMDSRMIGGFPASSVMRVVDLSGAPSSVGAFTSPEAAELQLLAGGASTKYVSKGGAAGVQIPTGAPASPAAGSIWFDGTNLRYSDGVNPTPYTIGASSGGTITGVTAGSGLAGGGTTGTVSLALAPSGVGAGSTKGSATLVPKITYDTYGRITGVVEESITGTVPNAGADGQVLKAIGGAWTSAPVRTGDLKSVSDEGSIFPAVVCTASETMYWNSGTDKFACQGIALGAPSAVVANSYKLVTVAADGRVNGGSSPTTLSGFGISDALDKNGGVTSLAAGNTVGRPPAGTAGRLYVDTQALTLYRDNGGSWDVIGSAGAAGTLTGVTAGAGLTGGGSSGNVSVALDTAGVVAVTNATKVTTDIYGRVTSSGSLAASDIPSLDWAKIGSGKPNSLSGYAISDALSNQNGIASVESGSDAGKGLTPTDGRLYIATDTKKIYRSSGGAWVEIVSAAGSGGTITDVKVDANLSRSVSGTEITVGLPNKGTAGDYYKVTTDAQGRVISGNASLVAADIPTLDWTKITGTPTTLSGYGIVKNYVENYGSAVSLSAGNTAGRPGTPYVAGRIYIDTQANTVSYDTGAAWQTITSGSGFTGSLGGEVSGAQGSTQVDSINGINRATITSNLNAVSAATDAATNSTLVKRDGTGGFSAKEVRLVDGTTNAVKLKAAGTSADYSLQFPAAAPIAGQSLQSDGSGVLSWVTTGAGALFDVIAGTGINVSGSGSTRTVSLTNTLGGAQSNIGSATAVPTISVDQQGRITAISSTTIAGVAPGGAASGDLGNNYPGPKVVGLQTTPVSSIAPGLGQVLKYVSSNWAASTLDLNDLKQNDNATSAMASASSVDCTSAKTMYYDTTTKSLRCMGIAGLDGGVITTGTIAAARLPASASYWSSATGGINYAGGGNVGIGTTNPGAALDVKGALRLSGATSGYVGFQPAAAAGSTTYTLPTADGTGGQVLSTNGSGVLSWLSPGGGGTVTSITAGTGLTGGTITGSGTIGLGTELAGLNGLSTTGFVKRTGAGTYTAGQASLTADVTGTLPVANGGTGITSGTSGGIPYFSAAGTIASSAALTNSQIVIGGGAGSAPTGVAAGTAGQILRSNGAGVAPSWQAAAAGTVTSVTGSAPIAVATGTTTPAISITRASTTVDGYLDAGDFVTFNNKLGTATAFGGDVSGTASAIAVNKIKGTDVAINALTSGNFLRYNGTNWVNSDILAADVPSHSAALITSGTLPVARGGTGITAGTSGGVPYFSAAGTIASSAALADSQLVIGGGAGSAPTVVAAGTAGQILKSNGAGNAPTWQADSGGVTSANCTLLNDTFSIPAGSNAQTNLACNATYPNLISGGCTSGTGQLSVLKTYPSSINQWTCSMTSVASSAQTATIQIKCCK